MAEEFQNTITFYGATEAVEKTAWRVSEALFENLRSDSAAEFAWLANPDAEPSGVDQILSDCLVDSVIFAGTLAKISLAFQTRRGPFPVRMLGDLMKEFPEVYFEIQTLGDCSGLIGILAKGGKNHAIRKLDLGSTSKEFPELFMEYFAVRACFPELLP
jgi:hypothetical protein